MGENLIFIYLLCSQHDQRHLFVPSLTFNFYWVPSLLVSCSSSFSLCLRHEQYHFFFIINDSQNQYDSVSASSNHLPVDLWATQVCRTWNPRVLSALLKTHK